MNQFNNQGVTTTCRGCLLKMSARDKVQNSDALRKKASRDIKDRRATIDGISIVRARILGELGG